MGKERRNRPNSIEALDMKRTSRAMAGFLKALRITAALTLIYGCLVSRAAAQLPDPNQGPGGPILVITSSASVFGKYYAEILRNEGLNEFSVADLATVSA